MQHKHDKRNDNRRGLSLPELALVVLTVGLFFATGTTMLKSYIAGTHLKATQQHMTEINKAIAQYIRINGKLPCIADLSAPQSSVATFGVEEGGGDCSTLAGSVANSYYLRKSTRAGFNFIDVAIGAVPVRSLNIPDEDMIDGWGNRFTYVVTIELATPPAAGTSVVDFTHGAVTLTDTSSGPGNPYISPPDSATYLVISYGPDGAGAFTAAGTASPVACPSSGSITERANCVYVSHPSGSAEKFATSLLTGAKTGAGGSVDFDDYVSVGTANSGVLAPSVQRIDGLTSGNYADCSTQGYIATACSAVNPATGSPCQGKPNTPHTTGGATFSSCQYTGCASGPYTYYTTCVRF